MLRIRRHFSECKSLSAITLVGICFLVAVVTVAAAGPPGALGAKPRLDVSDQ